MLPELLAASFLLLICVTIHAAGLTAVLRRIVNLAPTRELGFLAGTWLMARIAWCLLFIHLIQMAVWAVFYAVIRCLPDLETAFYFSVVTYTTLGYGDVVLDKQWRLLSGIEAVTGILMFGLSTGFFFAIITSLVRMQSPEGKEKGPPVRPSPGERNPLS